MSLLAAVAAVRARSRTTPSAPMTTARPAMPARLMPDEQLAALTGDAPDVQLLAESRRERARDFLRRIDEHADADQRHEPRGERRASQGARGVGCGARLPAQCEAGGIEREQSIAEPAERPPGSLGQCCRSRSDAIGICERFQESPHRVHRQSEGQHHDHAAAVWLPENGRDRTMCVGDAPAALAEAGEEREQTEDEIDGALDRKPEARERHDNRGRDAHGAGDCKKPRRSGRVTGRRLIDGRAGDWLVLGVLARRFECAGARPTQIPQ